MTHILAAANRMLEVSGFNIGNLKLQKLLYYVYGANLILNPEDELIEGPQAWHYGPVFPSVYHAFKRYGASDIKSPANPRNFVSVFINPALNRIILDVFDIYGGKPEFHLVQLTHQKGSPWADVYEPRQDKEIDKNSIKDYFEKYVIE